MVAAKKVRVSTDGTTWYTLPGNSAELTDEAGELKDTIFNQPYESTFPGLINSKLQAQAYYKGYAGYQATLKKVGTATAFTTLPCTLLSGKTYQINDASKQIWNRTATLNIFDNGVNQNANVETIDYLYGKVTFKSTYTVTGPVTITGEYYPLVAVGKATEFNLTQQAKAVDITDYDTAQSNSGHRVFDYGLKSVSLELNGIFATSNNFRALVTGRAEMIVEINPDGSGKSLARGFFRPYTRGQSGDVGELEEEKLSLMLSVPDDDKLASPFKWYHSPTSTLNAAVRAILDAFDGSTNLYVQYLHNGTNGVQWSSTLVTDASLKGGVEAMNEFTANFQCNGQATSV